MLVSRISALKKCCAQTSVLCCKLSSQPQGDIFRIIKMPKPPSGVFNTAQYKVPEYYAHNRYSYVDYDVEMADKRLPRPEKGVPDVQRETVPPPPKPEPKK